MNVTVASRSAGGWGVFAVVLNARGKVLYSTPTYAASNWHGAFWDATNAAKAKGWTVTRKEYL